jgi:hypothetical protein
VRKFLIAALAVLVAVAFTGAAAAATNDASMHAAIAPKKVGTKKHPKNTKLTLTVTNNDNHKTLKQLDIQLPKQLTMALKWPKICTEANLGANGPGACPKGSIVGGGTADAALGVDQPQPQPLHFVVTAVATGKKQLDFYLHSTTLTGLNVISKGRLKPNTKGTKLVVTVPKEAQQPAPGVYAGLVSLTTTLNKKIGSHLLVASTGCKKHKLPFSAVLHFGTNPVRPASTSNTSTTAKCS